MSDGCPHCGRETDDPSGVCVYCGGYIPTWDELWFERQWTRQVIAEVVDNLRHLVAKSDDTRRLVEVMGLGEVSLSVEFAADKLAVMLKGDILLAPRGHGRVYLAGQAGEERSC